MPDATEQKRGWDQTVATDMGATSPTVATERDNIPTTPPAQMGETPDAVHMKLE